MALLRLASLIGASVAEFEAAFNTAVDLPNAVQWSEGMWLAPEDSQG